MGVVIGICKKHPGGRTRMRVTDIYESSYRVMGGNLGGREQGTTIGLYIDNRNEQSDKWGDKAHLRIIAPLPSGENVAKTKSATGNIYAPTSRTVGAPRPRGHSAAIT
jgi:hypothetical protein